MRHNKKAFSLLVLIAGAFVLVWAGGAQAAETFACVPEGKIEKDISAAAELTEFVCFLKRWESAETLHFKVSVKNVSSTDQRFRVNIFLDNGKAVGGLLPRTTKKGLVKPGQTASFAYPVKGMTQNSGALTLRITTIGQ